MGRFGFSREDDFDDIISAAAVSFDVDADLLKATIATESGFRPEAFRAEPRINDASRGLMQVLYQTAKWLGYAGDPEGLLDPVTSITYGARYLAWQLNRYGASPTRATDAIAAYNAGTATKRPDGTYTNQQYVDKVLRYWRGYAEPRGGAPTTGAAPTTEPPATAPEPGGALLAWLDWSYWFAAPEPALSTAPAPVFGAPAMEGGIVSLLPLDTPALFDAGGAGFGPPSGLVSPAPLPATDGADESGVVLLGAAILLGALALAPTRRKG